MREAQNKRITKNRKGQERNRFTVVAEEQVVLSEKREVLAFCAQLSFRITATAKSVSVHKAKRTSGYLAPVLWTPGPSRGVCRVCLHIFAPIEVF